MPLGSLALAPPLINEAARRRQREHNAYMSTMAVRQQQLTERLLSLDDGLEALERLADLGDIAANEEPEQKGLSASDMSLLVCRWATDEDNETCPICLGEPAVGDRLCTLACCHTFHHKCVTQWLTVSALCPLCKSHALGEEEPHHVVGEVTAGQVDALDGVRKRVALLDRQRVRDAVAGVQDDARGAP